MPAPLVFPPSSNHLLCPSFTWWVHRIFSVMLLTGHFACDCIHPHHVFICFLHERSSLSCLWNQAEGKTNRTSKFRTFISLLIIFTSAASTESEPSLLKDNFHLWSITDLAVLKLFWTPLFPWGFSAFGGNYSVEFRTPIRVSSSTFYGHSAVFLCGHFYWNFFFHEKLCHSAVIP